jgi:hypothetical protein
MRSHERLIGDAEIQTSSDRSFGVFFGVVFLCCGLWPLLQKQEERGRLDYKHAFELD